MNEHIVLKCFQILYHMLYVKHSTPSGMPVFENKIGRLEEILFLPIWINHPTPPIVALSYHWWLDWDKLFNTPPQWGHGFSFQQTLNPFTVWRVGQNGSVQFRKALYFIILSWKFLSFEVFKNPMVWFLKMIPFNKLFCIHKFMI